MHDENALTVFCKTGMRWIVLSILYCQLISFSWASSDTDTIRLFDFTQNLELARSTEANKFLQSNLTSFNSPQWPIDVFLLGETYWMRGEYDKAKIEYRKLLDWSLDDPYDDEKYGSGLTGIAFWRLLQDNPREIAKDRYLTSYLLDAANNLLTGEALANELFKDSNFSFGLSKFKEDILQRLVIMAWESGNKKRAVELVFNLIDIKSDALFTKTEIEVIRYAIESDDLSIMCLALKQGKRLMELGHFDVAFKPIRFARESDNIKIRGVAGLHLARLLRIAGKSRYEIISVLNSVVEETSITRESTYTSVHPCESLNNFTISSILQNALYERAIRFNREGEDRIVGRAIADFERIIRDFPKGDYTDKALYELARIYQSEGEMQNAFDTYTILQRFRNEKGGNNREDSSYFRPALMHYTDRNFDEAINSLQKLLERPTASDVYRVISNFWLGRIYDERSNEGDEDKAKDYFKKVIEHEAFGYYTIRAKMHLNSGSKAAKAIMPDKKTNKYLREIYNKQIDETNLLMESAYLKRLYWALESGLYVKVFESEQILHKKTQSRFDKESPFYLEKSGLLTSLAVLLALRQDTLVAPDVKKSIANRIIIAKKIGMTSNDWTTAQRILEFWGGGVDLRRKTGYLSVAYPVTFFRQLLESRRDYGVQPELLYAVMRHESLFYPAAISQAGALGLFQFIPTTFYELDHEWKLLSGEQTPTTMDAYLSNPELSIKLGARWFRKLIANSAGMELFALMEHNAGAEAVNKWKNHWSEIERSDDIEYMIETARFLQTRIFVRDVLTGIAVMKASQIFGNYIHN